MRGEDFRIGDQHLRSRLEHGCRGPSWIQIEASDSLWLDRAMMSRSTRVVAVCALMCAVALSGCSAAPAGPSSPAGTSGSATAGGPASTATSGSGTPSAAGDEVTARSGGFSVVPPEGWGEATDQAAGVADVDLVLLSSEKVDGFANNLVVIALDGDESVLRDELDKGRQQMAAAGRTVTDHADRTIAGAKATGFSTAFEQQGIAVLARSYGIHRDGKVYLLTLSSSQSDADHAMSQFDELTSTWVWK